MTSPYRLPPHPAPLHRSPTKRIALPDRDSGTSPARKKPRIDVLERASADVVWRQADAAAESIAQTLHRTSPRLVAAQALLALGSVQPASLQPASVNQIAPLPPGFRPRATPAEAFDLVIVLGCGVVLGKTLEEQLARSGLRYKVLAGLGDSVSPERFMALLGGRIRQDTWIIHDCHGEGSEEAHTEAHTVAHTVDLPQGKIPTTELLSWIRRVPVATPHSAANPAGVPRLFAGVQHLYSCGAAASVPAIQARTDLAVTDAGNTDGGGIILHGARKHPTSFTHARIGRLIEQCAEDKRNQRSASVWLQAARCMRDEADATTLCFPGRPTKLMRHSAKSLDDVNNVTLPGHFLALADMSRRAHFGDEAVAAFEEAAADARLPASAELRAWRTQRAWDVHMFRTDARHAALRDALFDACAGNGATCLAELALYDDFVEVVRWLLAKGVSPTVQDANGYNILMNAIDSGNDALLALIREFPAPVLRTLIMQSDQHGNNALLGAAMEQRADLLEWLLRLGASPTHTNRKGWNAATIAAKNADLATLALLERFAPASLESMLQAPAGESRMNAWHLVCAFGRTELFRWMVERFALPVTGNAAGENPLMLAAGEGHTPIVRVIVEHALATPALLEANAEGDDAMSCALRFRRMDAAFWLARVYDEARLIDALQHDGALGDVLDRTVAPDGTTLFHLAIRIGLRKVVRAGVDQGATLWPLVRGGPHFLSTAVAAGRLDMLEMLASRSRFGDENEMMDLLPQVRTDGLTPLALARTCNDGQIADWLVRHGAAHPLDPVLLNSPGQGGRWPLERALLSGNMVACDLLLNAGAKITPPDGPNMALIALQLRHEEALQQMAQHDADEVSDVVNLYEEGQEAWTIASLRHDAHTLAWLGRNGGLWDDTADSSETGDAWDAADAGDTGDTD